MLELLFVFLTIPTFASQKTCEVYKLSSLAQTEDAKFRDFLKKDWDVFMRQTPEWASDLGYSELAGAWSDDSLAAIEKRRQLLLDCAAKAFNSLKRSKLNAENKTHYDLYQNRLKMAIEGWQYSGHLMPLNQMDGVHTSIVDTLVGMPSKNLTDFENKLKRLRSAATKIQQHKILMEEGLKSGLTPPQVVLKNVPKQFDSLLTKSADESGLFEAFKNVSSLNPEEGKRIQQEARDVIEKVLFPELNSLKQFLVDKYIPGSRQTLSVQKLPNGTALYDWSVRYHTTTQMTPEEIHQLGLSEVKRILNEMNGIREKVKFKGDLKKFNEFLRTDSQFYFKDPKELMTGYRDISKRADAELPKLFGTLPRMSYGVREMEAFKAPSSPTAYYYAGSQDTGRAGFFVANTHNLKSRPKWGMEALTLHEAVPGHHLQIAIAQELKDMPDFRKYGGYTAFSEGWGLYAESLGEEMGFYQDPYAKYGQLTYEMWRAVRLVVDTGLHLKNWTREEAVQYFRDHTPMTLPDIQVEVDRYIVWPGQALAYKIGQLRFLELRKQATEKLKDKFDVRKFHDLVLSKGSVPLNVLEKDVNLWIDEQLKNKKSILN
jgi:uncharacterized protein (DUF885 family)